VKQNDHQKLLTQANLGVTPTADVDAESSIRSEDGGAAEATQVRHTKKMGAMRQKFLWTIGRL
jgi:hypothetical protein